MESKDIRQQYKYVDLRVRGIKMKNDTYQIIASDSTKNEVSCPICGTAIPEDNIRMARPRTYRDIIFNGEKVIPAELTVRRREATCPHCKKIFTVPHRHLTGRFATHELMLMIAAEKRSGKKTNAQIAKEMSVSPSFVGSI